jgi:hypothetical protein
MMNVPFSTLPAWLLFIIIVGGSMGLVYVSTLLTRSLMKKPPVNDTRNEIAGFFFSIVGVVYAVLLAFLVISVWDNFRTADLATTQEASDIITVARDSTFFPEPTRREVHDQLRQFTELVIKNGWSDVHADQGVNLGYSETLAAFNSLWSTYQQLPPNAVDANALRSLDDLSQQGVLRLLSSKAVLPGIFWVVLVVGAGVVVYFGLIFYLEDIRLHLFMLMLLTGLIATCIWLIVVIDNPYLGDLQVSSEAFKYALHVIDTLPR